MGASEFNMNRGAILKIETRRGDRLRVQLGDVWVTQHEDSNDYLLKAGDSMNLRGKGCTLVTAYEPTLLELYRRDSDRA